MSSRMIGVDVGGTFTDVFVLNEMDGSAVVAKVPTTRPDQSEGFLIGIAQQVPDLLDVSVVVHGTTAGTNALLERKGAKTGVICTEGLRDVLEMRRRDRPRTWGLRGDFEPVVDRRDRLEVPERTLADGSIRTPVDLQAVCHAAETLRHQGCVAVAVLFANAYANGENEAAAVAAVREIWPNAHVSASSEILPEIREFERFSTTALNAYLQPEVSGYLSRLEVALKSGGFEGEFMIVQSNGGVMAVETASRLPIRTALSGPAAGVIAAGYISSTAGFENVITGDMGGTSFDVSLIADGHSMLSPQTSIDFGMVVRTPMIEITTIGAGGGSIAWVDKGGLLNIGPESAGSDPGPVAYGLGNDRPTVTDANVVLGRIDPDNPIGGNLKRLDVKAASKAIDTHVGVPLELDSLQAAEAILRVANSRMAGAIRLVSVERGFDPKRFAFMPFGGGGALHAGAMLAEVGIARAIVPRYPGVTSAMGCVIADMRQDFVQTINSLVDTLDEAALAGFMQSHADDGMAMLDAARTRFEARDLNFEFDMAYIGQTHTVSVPIDVTSVEGRVAAPSAEEIDAAFDAAYSSTFGRLLENGVRRIINLRTSVTGKRPKFDLATLAPETSGAALPKTSRPVHFSNRWHETAIYDRLSLPIDTIIDGPAILEQADTTVLIEPGLRARVDGFGNYNHNASGGSLMSDFSEWDLSRTALLTIDLQNDFIHPEGAYGRAGQSSDTIGALPARVSPFAAALRQKGGCYISAQFTLVPGRDGMPLIAPHLKQLRPFLGKGDFAPGSFGHRLVDALHPADFVIEKVAYSAFFQTRLEYIMRAVGIDHLIVGGIVTNGGVASTLRDAHLRNINTVMLTDGCAAFRQDVHDATILSLGSVTHQMTCAEALTWVGEIS